MLKQTTPVRFCLLAKLATKCSFVFINIFGFLHKVWEVSRVALLSGMNALELHDTIFTLRQILTAGEIRKLDFLVIETLNIH